MEVPVAAGLLPREATDYRRMNREARETLADWLMLLGGLALLGSLFATWSHQFSAAFLARYGGSALLSGVPRDPDAWQVYSAMDVVLALVAAGLVVVAVLGGRRARLGALVAAAAGLAFCVHALIDAPTSGAVVFAPAAGSYADPGARPGAGETIAVLALAVGIGGLALSFSADPD